MLEYQKFKVKAEEVIDIQSSKIDIERLNENFDIHIITLSKEIQFAGISATVRLNTNSNEFVCIGALPAFKNFRSLIFVMTLKENKQEKPIVNHLKSYRFNSDQESLENLIQNILVTTSSNLVISEKKYEELKVKQQISKLHNLHLRSINPFKIEMINYFQPTGFSLF